ncbi:matrix metalloproteinase-19 isoform x2 [Stemphylium lycopersici]|uniref:Matrix metalloproteinase-19 isoform x2 n=1 Tax=Stemphylium lycopersici TaxID=183478 RepID=A0A364NED4_STELY|nr:matrix metalloproteinase-19 isoform x2 [Stemphylium lycopersici]
MLRAATLLLLGVVHFCLATPHHHAARGTTLIPTSSLSAPTKTPTTTPKADQKQQSKHINDFYRLYGWLKPGNSVPDHDLPKAIRKIQRKLKEPITGALSDKMMNMMSGPRCGTEQPYNATEAEDHSSLDERYVLWGPKWAKTTLTWRFESYSGDLPTARQQSTLSAAFAQWMNFIPLNIVPAASNARADINIRFVPLGRDDTRYGYTSMVSEGIYLSSGNINITFNDDYQWTDDRLFTFTAVHEIGHALGMSHSGVESAIMFAYYDGTMRPIHADDKMGVHSIYGWKTPKWIRIDSRSTINSMIQVTSNSVTASANDGLYQMHSTGQILRFVNGAWTTVDNNKDTAQITGANGNLYQRHFDGGTFRWTGSASNWQAISNTDTNVVDIVAAADQLYSRRKDGWVARLSGSSWVSIQQPSAPGSKQIAVTDNRTLWNLLTNGYLVRSIWPYDTGSWTIVDNNPGNIVIAVGGNEFYKLQSDGAVVWLDNAGPYWSVIERAGSVGIHAVGTLLYSRHGDGTIWRWTGTQNIWEMIDERSGSLGMVGDRVGGVWELRGGGEIWTLTS